MSEFDELIRIHVNELRIGMRVCKLETIDKHNPFLLDILDIKTQTDIQAIQKVCDYVLIDVKWQKAQHGYLPTRHTNEHKKLKFASAFDHSANTFQQTSQLIKTVLDDIRFGNQFNEEAVKESVNKTVDQVLENPDAMLLMTQLKNQDEYTAQHSMNVCVLSILLGREIGLPREELNKLGLCGLLHDIGKMRVPLEVLNKPGKLEADEMILMRKHTIFGRDVLMSARDIFLGTVDVAYGHHENLDGSGYPRGINDLAITKFTRLVTIVDAYDAITSDRVYQRGKPHLIALGILVKGMHTQFESGFVTHFINCIGFYPQGNLVELSSGEIGIVVEQNHLDRLKPKILLITDEQKKNTERRILDLAEKVTDAKSQPYRVKQIIRPQDFDIDLKKLQEDGLFTKAYRTVNTY